MTAVLENTPTLQEGSGTSLTVNMPSTRPAGDLYVMFVTMDGNPDDSVTTSGEAWTRIGWQNDAGTVSSAIFKMTGGASEPSTVSVGGGGTEYRKATILRFSSAAVHVSTPRNSNPLRDFPAYHATRSDSLVFGLIGIETDAPGDNPPTGWTTTLYSDGAAGASGFALAQSDADGLRVDDGEYEWGGTYSDNGTSWIIEIAYVPGFDAMRQGIIDGMDSAQSEANGWDAEVKGGAVTEVVRTSSSVITRTLAAYASYAITADETITVILPLGTLLTDRAVTASAAFDITNASAGFSATAAPSIQRFTAAATAKQTHAATAAPALQRVTAAATAAQTHAATAAPTISSFTAAATATQTHSASAAATIRPFTAAATASRSFTTSAATTIRPFTAAATANRSFTTSAAITLRPFTASATSTSQVNITATATATIQRFTASATATQTQTATAAVTIRPFTASATAANTYTASAAPALQRFTATATASRSHASTAAPSLQRFTAAATATQTHSASVAATIQRYTASATSTSQVNITTSAAVAIQRFVAAATADRSFTTSATPALQLFKALATMLSDSDMIAGPDAALLGYTAAADGSALVHTAAADSAANAYTAGEDGAQLVHSSGVDSADLTYSVEVP